MTEIKFSHEFDFALESVIEGREARYENPEWWPDITGSEVKAKTEENGITYISRLVQVRNAYAANPIFKQANYEALEKTTMNLSQGLYQIKSEFLGMQKIMEFNEFSEYIKDKENPDKCIRNISLKVHIKVPVVGKVAEGIITKEYKKISDKDHLLILEYLEKK